MLLFLYFCDLFKFVFMSVINILKNYFFNKYIQENLQLRKPKLISLQRAKSIGFLCNITDEDSYKNIFSLFSKFQNANRTLWLIGYVDDKSVPYYCLQQLTADYFCKKELNWFGKPVKVQIDDFIKKDFDMLIDFTQKPFQSIQYILKLTQSGFIVGGNQHHKNDYDLFIDIQNKDPYMLLENINLYTKKLMGEAL